MGKRSKQDFDKSYWKATSNSRRKTCNNCGHLIIPDLYSSTGWTHSSSEWQGIRCQNMLVGATPAFR